MSNQNIIQREELALAHGLERLRMSNSVLGLHIEDAAFGNKDIEAYLKRSIGENIALDEEIENKLKRQFIYLSAAVNGSQERLLNIWRKFLLML